MRIDGPGHRLFGLILTLLVLLSLANCGGGGSSGGTKESPIPGNVTLIEARTSGKILVATVNDTVLLDGSKSYISSNTPDFTSTNVGLSYNWSFTHIPELSSATLLNASTAAPSFVADMAGDYIVQLIVSANGNTSDRAVQSIVVAESGELKPTGPFNHVGLSTNCAQCHSGDINLDTQGNKIMGKSVTHVATSMLCQSCHTPKGFNIIIHTDHQEVFGDCSTCHDGVTAVGKSSFHIQTGLECDDCHNTVSFLTLEADGTYDHSNISRACSGCHDGIIAIGKTDTDLHNNTTTDCGYCHTTVDFKDAYPDHTGPDVVGQRCDSCHGNNSAQFPGRGSEGFHSTMSVDCAVCHVIEGFNSSGYFNHSVIDISVTPQLPACSECHDDSSSNIGATQKPDTTIHNNTTSDCFVCHNTTDFTAAYIDHTQSPVTDFTRCDACHGNTTPVFPAVTATGLSTPHVATNGADCGACHTPGTFSTGIFDHTVVDMNTTRCDSCHDGDISRGLSSNHIPLRAGSPADCDVCHNDTSYTSFATSTLMVHTDAGVDISVCGVCHDGDKSTGKSVGHVPTNSFDCVDCHYDAQSYTSFTLTTFDHVAIDANDCASCHDAGFATPKSATHIPSVGECSICHTDTSVGGFQNNIFRPGDHDTLTTGCEGCHVSNFFPNNAAAYKASSHLPTSQDCYYCHTASATDFTTSIFSHQGISSNCASCHDGSANNVAALAVGEPNDSVHTGIDSDCSICHNTSGWVPQDVDHSRPDILSVRCDSCHNGNFEPAILGKNQGHPVTSSDCSVCHNTTTFVGGMVDHTSAQVTSVRCDSCHNGTDATGLSGHPTNNHIPVTDDCGSCHIAGGTFKPSTFDHVGITNNCESCHDGSFTDSNAVGKNVGHVTTTSDCSVCHNTTAFAGARFNHSTITSSTRCDSCHNGTTAQGKEPPLGHVPTGQDCRECHQTTGFLPATFDHAGITDNCSSCHDAGFATPKPSGHIITGQDCGVCHSGFDSFAGGTFDHSTVSSTTRCDSCHDGNTATGKADAVPAHIATTLDCRSCHTTATFTDGSWTHDSSSAGNCTNCHANGGGATEQSASHITANAQCDECHTTSSWAFSHRSSDYPGTHSSSRIGAFECGKCHTGSHSSFPQSDFPITRQNFPWSDTPAYAPQCGACHYSEGTREHGTKYTDCTGSRCHSVGDRSWD